MRKIGDDAAPGIGLRSLRSLHPMPGAALPAVFGSVMCTDRGQTKRGHFNFGLTESAHHIDIFTCQGLVYELSIHGETPMKSWLVVFTLGVLLALSPVAADVETLTNEDVVKLTQAGLGSSVIVAKIASSQTAFDTSVEALDALSENEVAQEVLAAMLAAGSVEEEVPTTQSSAGPIQGAPADSSAATRSSPASSSAGGTERPSSGAAPQPKAIPVGPFRETLRGGGEGPEMVVIPGGSFRMGCLSNDSDCFDDEKPVHPVTIARPFAVSVHEVTFEDYDRFTYPNKVDDEGWGRGRRPVINVSWDDAKEYVTWLSSETGAEYRLLSEAEWEYAARAGSTMKYSWGNTIGTNRANCYVEFCGDSWEYTAPVGSFAPNAFGLYDMHGNVWEWVEDCWNDTYSGAPADGSVWWSGDCAKRVLRGGSWVSGPGDLRAANRDRNSSGVRYYLYRFPGGPDARSLNPYAFTSCGGFQGGLAPLGGFFREF